MTIPTSRENSTRALSTADLAAASRPSPRVSPDPHEAGELEGEEVTASQRDDANTDLRRTRDNSHEEPLEPLFAAEQADGFRSRWIAIQSSFVDDPSAAVRAGDELVAQVMSELADSFAGQRARIESQLSNSGPGNTEDLRVALRSYRSFFERLLSL